MTWPLKTIVSGLQTGADQAGLFAAAALGIPTGGYCTRDCRTEAGPAPEFAKRFGVEPFPTDDYAVRTLLNVKRADGTVVFGRVEEPGTALTVRLVALWKGMSNLCCNPTAEILRAWILRQEIQTLNVAGNRLSKLGVAGYNDAVSVLLLGLKAPGAAMVDPETLWLPQLVRAGRR
jgi:hypothetical protein